MYQQLQALVAGATFAFSSFFGPLISAGEGNHHPHTEGLPNVTLEWIESFRQKYDIPGISLGIIATPHHTGLGWENETYGFGHMNHYGRSMDGDSLLSIASNSKLFAAISVGLLINNNTILETGEKFDYSTKVKDILHWDLVDPYMTDHLDVLDLLSMRSGIPAHDRAYAEECASKIVARLNHLRPSTEIRQIMQYNNIHYWAIAEIVALVSQSAYPDYVQTHILDPLNMTDSYYNHTLAEETGNRVEPFVRAGINYTRCMEVWAEDNELDRSCYGRPFPAQWLLRGNGLYFAGPGGLVTSASDMMKWLRELLDPKVLPKHVISETHKSFIPFGQVPSSYEEGLKGYGQGQITTTYRGHEMITHWGNVPGFGSQIIRLPGVGIGIFIGINDNNIGTLVQETILYRILDTVLGLDLLDWEERRVKESFKIPLQYTAIPNKRPAPSIDAIMGKYSDTGYGSLEFLRFDPALYPHDPQRYFSKKYLDAMREAMTTIPGLSEPLVYSDMNKMFGRVYVLSHFDGPIFNITMINLETSPEKELNAYVGPTATAVFVEGKGLGMFENFRAGDHGKRAVEEDVEKHAEVWFSKD